MKQSFLKFENIKIPKFEIGLNKNPSTLIISGIHGDEQVGQLLIYNLLLKQKIEQRWQNGSLTILPQINVEGLRKGTDVVPRDNLNLNRVFPGNQNSKKFSERFAFYLFNLAEKFDVIIDIHNFTSLAPRIGGFIGSNNQELDLKTLELLYSYSPDFIWKINPKKNKSFQKSLGANLVIKGKQVIIIENPPSEFITSKQIEDSIRGLNNILITLGHLRGNKKCVQKRRAKIVERFNVQSTFSGVFIPQVKIGQHIKKNDCLGHIINVELKKNKKNNIIAHTSGIIINLLPCQWVNKKEKIGAIAKIIK